MEVNKLGIGYFFTLVKDSKLIIGPTEYKKRVDDILTMESEFGKELELWTGLTSHEIIDNVDSVQVNMEAQLKIRLMSI